MLSTKPLTDLNAANLALGLLGEQTISSFTESNKEARQASLHFNQTLRELSESRRWSKGRKRLRLTREQSSPQFGYKYAFRLPDDLVKVFDVKQLSEPIVIDGVTQPDLNPVPLRRFEIEDDLLLVDCEHVGIVYGSKIPVSRMSPLFIKAFTYELAARMSTALGESRLMMPLSEKAEQLLQDAWMSDVKQTRSGENSDFDQRSEYENPQLGARDFGY